MKKEHKELLLKDLCARLPYGVKVRVLVKRDEPSSVEVLTLNGYQGDSKWKLWIYDEKALAKYGYCGKGFYVDEVKPYLRPMSSMTEDEFVYFMGLRGRMLKSHEIQSIMKESFNMPLSIGIGTTLGSYSNKIDWLNKNHFDYRGLIEKNIAIKVTKDNNPYKE